MWSVYEALWNNPNFSFLAQVSTKFTKLSMLFVLELACSLCSACELEITWHAQIGKLQQNTCQQSKI